MNIVMYVHLYRDVESIAWRELRKGFASQEKCSHLLWRRPLCGKAGPKLGM